MKYKTTINITSEARDRDEALDIVEDYLAGNLRTGVDMNCATRPVCNSAKITCAIALSLVVIGAVVVPTQLKIPQSPIQSSPAISAVQPPLNTDRVGADFKKRWEERQTKKALDYIKG